MTVDIDGGEVMYGYELTTNHEVLTKDGWSRVTKTLPSGSFALSSAIWFNSGHLAYVARPVRQLDEQHRLAYKALRKAFDEYERVFDK